MKPVQAVCCCALALLVACHSASSFDPDDWAYDVSVNLLELSFFPVWASEPGGEGVTVVEQTGLVFDEGDGLDIWAADAETAADVRAWVSEACDVALELLALEHFPLTIVCFDELPTETSPALADHARGRSGYVIAWPSSRFIDDWFWKSFDASLVSLGLSEEERAATLAYSQGTNPHYYPALLFEGSMRALVRHEIGHLAVDCLLQGERKPSVFFGNPYATRLDDWIDEMVATLFETPELGEMRLADLGNLRGHALSLPEFFASSHPDAQDPSETVPPGPHDWFGGRLNLSVTRRLKAAPEAVEESPRQAATAAVDEEELTPIESDLLWYAQCRVFGEFLLEFGGPQLLRAVIEDADEGTDVATTLGALDPPRDVAQLEELWHVWLDERCKATEDER